MRGKHCAVKSLLLLLGVAAAGAGCHVGHPPASVGIVPVALSVPVAVPELEQILATELRRSLAARALLASAATDRRAPGTPALSLGGRVLEASSTRIAGAESSGAYRVRLRIEFQLYGSHPAVAVLSAEGAYAADDDMPLLAAGARAAALQLLAASLCDDAVDWAALLGS